MNKLTDEINNLLQTFKKLRDPSQGCPWDKEQDFKSIASCSIEEAYEVADAIEREDFNDLKESVNACHGSKQSNIYILKILRWLVDKKLISFKQGASFLEWLERKIGTPSIEKQIEGLPSIYGLARGLKDNKNASVAVTLSEEELSNSWGMGAITGFPLAFGLKLLLENKINKKGVFAPEGGAINPDDFFSLLTDHPLSVSRSWET